MAEIVRLKHITRKNDWKFYFYDGSVPVKGGIIELPADNFTRVRRAWLMGFRLTEDGQPISVNHYDEIVAKATVKDSLEEQDENTSSGRQSSTTDRVRESESQGSGDTVESGSRSSVSSGPRARGRRTTANTRNKREVSTAK